MSNTDPQTIYQPLVVQVQKGPRKDLELNPVAVIRQVSDSEEALSALSDRIDNLDQTVANHVRFDIGNQELTDEQKANARTNIGAEEAISALSARIEAEEQTREQADLVLQNLVQTNQLDLALKADQSDLDATNEQVETNRLALLSKADIAALATLTALVGTKADQAYVNDQIAALVDTDGQLLATIQAISQELANAEGLLETLDQTVANRVRFDVANQALTSLQKSNARTNIGAEEQGEAARLIALITAASIGAATSLQGQKADTALQSRDVAPVALSGLFSSLAGQNAIFNVLFSGYTVGSNLAVTAMDTLGQAIGKLQGQINALASGIQAPEYVTPTVLKNFTNTLISTPPQLSECLLDTNFNIPAGTLVEGDVYMLHAFLISRTVSQATVSFLVVPHINNANLNGSNATVAIPTNGNTLYEIKCYITVGAVGNSGSISVSGQVYSQQPSLVAFSPQTVTYNTNQEIILNFPIRVNAALNANSWLKLRSAKLLKLK